MFQFTHPGRGATWLRLRLTWAHNCFNSRTPGGVRHAHTTQGTGRRLFQFTHPGRGATAHYGVDVPRGRGVSIHAPREGCDSEILILDDQPSMFQFTHPGRGATGSGAGFPPRELSFNSRTPGGVRRTTAKGRRARATVSIHAPREGCDTPSLIIVRQERGFNSRTPGGVRRSGGRLSTKATEFQFTHPGRGATDTDDLRRRSFDVSIHAPREGCDDRPPLPF